MKTKTNRTTDTKPTNPSVMQRTPFMNSIGWQPAPKPSHSTLVRSTLYALTLYALLTHHTLAQSWSTVDDFQYVAGQGAYNTALAVAPNSTLLAAGDAYDAADGGASWSTVDDVAPFSGSWFNQPNAIAADAVGSVYVAGFLNTTSTRDAWIVRKSVDGTSFSTVDSLPSGIGATALFVHPTAGIFVAGQANVVVKGVTVRAWIVRRSTNAGATWQTVDTLYGTKGSTYYFGRAYGVGADAHGNLYVAGALAIPYRGSAVWEWVVRKSTNGGSSWSTVDTYQLAPGGNSVPAGFVADSNGNLYVAGYGSTTYWGAANWIVRWNPGGGNSWQTL